MNWRVIKRHESYLSKQALLAAGKALSIANEFENTCKFILHVAKLSEFLRNTPDPVLETFNKAFRERMLHGTLKALSDLSYVSENEVSVLERAKDARNYIAHEGAVFLASENRWLVVAALKTLRQQVLHLINGHNLVSLWEYEIQNKQPGSRQYFELYPTQAEIWVFGRLLPIIDRYSFHPRVIEIGDLRLK